MSKILTIQDVTENNLCTGCGTCVSLCPKGLIKMHRNDEKGIYNPVLEHKGCTNCNLCIDACPGHSVDFNTLNKFIFGKNPDNILLGNYENCYTGHAVDNNIRYNGSSGGLITSLLIFALEEGLIDGALVTKMSEENPMEPYVFIARTREDIIEASKSKYCPVPANIAIRSILNSEGKFAVVGLPCHIHGVRKAEMLNKKLSEKIVLHIGIFCGHTPNFNGTEYLLYRLGINKEQVKKIDYRGEGWPGRLSIKLKNGDNKIINYSKYWNKGFGFYFYPDRCTLCFDGISELSDISFGDAWLSELRTDQIGTSIIIGKTKNGDKILQQCHIKNKIVLNKISAEKVIESQRNILNFKKKGVYARIFIKKLFNRKTPNYALQPLKPSINDYLQAASFYFWLWISSKHLWYLLSAHNVVFKVKKTILKT